MQHIISVVYVVNSEAPFYSLHCRRRWNYCI